MAPSFVYKPAVNSVPVIIYIKPEFLPGDALHTNLEKVIEFIHDNFSCMAMSQRSGGVRYNFVDSWVVAKQSSDVNLNLVLDDDPPDDDSKKKKKGGTYNPQYGGMPIRPLYENEQFLMNYIKFRLNLNLKPNPPSEVHDIYETLIGHLYDLSIDCLVQNSNKFAIELLDNPDAIPFLLTDEYAVERLIRAVNKAFIISGYFSCSGNNQRLWRFDQHVSMTTDKIIDYMSHQAEPDTESAIRLGRQDLVKRYSLSAITEVAKQKMNTIDKDYKLIGSSIFNLYKLPHQIEANKQTRDSKYSQFLQQIEANAMDMSDEETSPPLALSPPLARSQVITQAQVERQITLATEDEIEKMNQALEQYLPVPLTEQQPETTEIQRANILRRAERATEDELEQMRLALLKVQDLMDDDSRTSDADAYTPSASMVSNPDSMGSNQDSQDTLPPGSQEPPGSQDLALMGVHSIPHRRPMQQARRPMQQARSPMQQAQSPIDYLRLRSPKRSASNSPPRIRPGGSAPKRKTKRKTRRNNIKIRKTKKRRKGEVKYKITKNKKFKETKKINKKKQLKRRKKTIKKRKTIKNKNKKKKRTTKQRKRKTKKKRRTIKKKERKLLTYKKIN